VLALLEQLVAAFRVMHPKADIRHVHRVLWRLRMGARPVREIDKRLLTTDELVRIGTLMMDEAEAMPKHGRVAAKCHRDGALIAAGAQCPLRLRNWLMARIDQHLLFDEHGGATMSFAADEMKGRRAVEFSLPWEIALKLRRYVEYFRPLLLKPG